MTAFWGLFKKELKVAYTTPVAYVVFFLFSMVSSLIFWLRLLEFERTAQRAKHMSDPTLVDLINFNDVIITYLFTTIEIVFVFVMPILTMRLIAEERRQKTLELLLTSPVRPWQIVAGKYAATCVSVLALCGLALVYPVILHVFGQSTLVAGSAIDWPATWLGLFGLFLAGAMFAAAGLFFSSVTENQIVAALIGLMSFLFLWFLGLAGEQAETGLGAVMIWLSPMTHLASFAKGVLSTADVGYFVSAVVLFLFLTHRTLEANRWT